MTTDNGLPPEAHHVFQMLGFAEPATLNEILATNSDADGWLLPDDEVFAFCQAAIGVPMGLNSADDLTLHCTCDTCF